MTVVVVNEHNCPVLGAACVTTSERKDSWKRFFSWIKKTIPSFNPFCVVTDGATYIYDAFVEAVPDSKAKNIVCWWHRNEQARKKHGLEQKVRQKILSLAYACDPSEVETIQGQIEEMVQEVTEPRTYNRLMKEYEKQKSTMAVNLKCFTARNSDKLTFGNCQPCFTE